MIKDLIAALQFLTVVPLPIKTEMNNLCRGVRYFPVAGLFIGVVCALLFQGLLLVVPSPLAAAITAVFYAAFTRGLHLDGLMDCVDAFFSYKSPEIMLKIMKESTVGSFAVLAGAGWFLLFWQLLQVLSFKELICVMVLSRSGVLLLPIAFTYVRSSGTGKFFADSVNKSIFLYANLLTVGILLLLNPYFLLLLPLNWGLIWLWGNFSKQKIEGYTGDVIGAGMELSLIIISIVLVVAMGMLESIK